jgi:Polyketide cyclase / dehydrase and lipid transport
MRSFRHRLHAPAGGRSDHQWRYDLSIAIRRQPDEVFAFLADVQDAEPIPQRAAVTMVKEPAVPTAVGTRWHERVRIAPGLWLHVESVVTDVARPARLGMDFHSKWFTGHLTYEIQPDTSGSLLCQRETLQPRGPLRWLDRVIEPYLRRQLVRRLQDIRQLLERETTLGSTRYRRGW